MSMGLGAMIHVLGGGSIESADKYYGRKIKSAKMLNDKFYITFTGGSQIVISDDGQSCCETRYMTCDDNPADLVGGKLRGIEVKKIDDVQDEYEQHDVAFLEIATDTDSITFCTHVEHNGYYGGFSLNITETKKSR
jgi:hypothetical protein